MTLSAHSVASARSSTVVVTPVQKVFAGQPAGAQAAPAGADLPAAQFVHARKRGLRAETVRSRSLVTMGAEDSVTHDVDLDLPFFAACEANGQTKGVIRTLVAKG